MVCPQCGWSTRARHNWQPNPSTWWTLDLGAWRVVVRARLRRLDCPTDGVIVEAVPLARHRARFTADFEALVAWCATKMDATAVARLTRIAWSTVGEIVARVTADEIDPARLEGLCEIGVDEISWRRHHNYLTVVVNHRTGDVVWTDEGKDTAALDRFFAAMRRQCRSNRSGLSELDTLYV